MDTQTILIAALVALVVVLATNGLLLFFRRTIESRDKVQDSEKVTLDIFRAHLEKQLAELNYKFAISEDRWRQVNHLVLAGQSEKVGPAPEKESLGFDFLKSHGVDPKKIETRDDLIFVLTPYHPDFLDEFETIVKVGQRFDLTVSRGDERVLSGDIFTHLLRLIVESRLIVANITGRNPNVFYELGVAHALDKPVIIISRNIADVPFDVKGKRIIVYRDQQELDKNLELMLARTLVQRGNRSK